MRLPRASGILLHPTSLPGRFGIGDLGPRAIAFLDFLAETGQRWWQMLPLGPIGAGNSPYQSYSSYAGNPLLISPEGLVDDGWLTPGDWKDYPALPDDHVDFDGGGGGQGGAPPPRVPPLRARSPRLRGVPRGPGALARRLRPLHGVEGGPPGGRRGRPGSPSWSIREPKALARCRAELARGDPLLRVRPVRLRPAVAVAARGVPGAGDPADRRRADLRRAGQCRRLGAARPVPARRGGSPALRRGGPARLLQRDGPALGEPALSLGGARRGEVRLVDRPAEGHDRARGPGPARPLPRVPGLLGGPRGLRPRPRPAAGRWGRGPRSSKPSATGSAASPSSPRTWARSRPRSRRSATASTCPGCASSSSPSAATRAPSSTSRTATSTTASPTPARTTTTPRSAGSAPTTPGARRTATGTASNATFALRYLGTDGEEFHWDLIRVAMASVADTVDRPARRTSSDSTAAPG